MNSIVCNKYSVCNETIFSDEKTEHLSSREGSARDVGQIPQIRNVPSYTERVATLPVNFVCLTHEWAPENTPILFDFMGMQSVLFTSTHRVFHDLMYSIVSCM